MATEISNGRQTVKLYHSVNRGKAMYQLAYYAGGRRVQKNFADKAEAKRVAKQILGELSNDAEAIEAMATPELESLIAARRVLASDCKAVLNRPACWLPSSGTPQATRRMPPRRSSFSVSGSHQALSIPTLTVSILPPPGNPP